MAGLGLELQLPRDLDLVVEDQAVLAAPREVVQADAQVLQDALVDGDVGGLGVRDDAGLGERGPGACRAPRRARATAPSAGRAARPGLSLSSARGCRARPGSFVAALLLLESWRRRRRARRDARPQALVQLD